MHDDLPPLLAGMRVRAGYGYSEVLPTIDFETYSEAGYVWHEDLQKWKPLAGMKDKGLFAVGHRVYAEHPTAEVITFSYDMMDGQGVRRWQPGQPNPQALFDWLAAGNACEGHNVAFERSIWMHVCVPKYGWPPLPARSLRCSAAKSRAWGLPGSLEEVGRVLQLATQKDKDGKRLMRKFSMPRDPTLSDRRLRVLPHEDPEEFEAYCRYCDTDVATEHGVSLVVPDLIPDELEFWLCDQEVNYRGIGVDLEAVDSAISIIGQVIRKYDAELYELTGHQVPGASKTKQLSAWLRAQGYPLTKKKGKDEEIDSVDSATVEAALERTDLPAHVRRALEIRQFTGSASVKKAFSMRAHATQAARLHDLFIYHGARTGRDTHADVQPGNLPKDGPSLRWCEDAGCGKPYGQHLENCPWCGASAAFSRKDDWSFEAVEDALHIVRTRSADAVEYFFGDAMLTLTGCTRSFLQADPGNNLISGDYSAIEAVVTAALAGEEWRLQAFRNKEEIYYHGAASVTGKSYQWYMDWSAENGGKKHPDRNKIGKVAELALGFAGGVGAWRNFDSTDTFTDDEVKAIIRKWQAASPAVVELWGGQIRGKPWKPDYYENYGLEGCFVAAILNPNQRFTYRYISFECIDDVLYAILPSGRPMAYHQPRLSWTAPKRFPDWAPTNQISYMTWNTNPAYGPKGWVRIDTHRGKIVENMVQAVARDIMAHAVVNLERAGYPVVLRVHDELASEVPIGYGSEQEFRSIMETLPAWCADWPIRTGAPWTGRRYRKD